MSLTVDDLLKNLKKSRLLSDSQLAVVSESVGAAAQPQSAEKLVSKLVKQGVLTGWQGKMLLQKQTGFVLGQYKLLTPIGQGGMGKVFKAWDRKNKRNVAIKVLSKRLAKNKKLVARFKREIMVASKLDSPYIVKTLDAGEIGQSHFMVMEYVEGESLDDIASRQGRVKASHACELARQAALGLVAAQSAGMVHRDIKPGNLMVTFKEEKPCVHLLDMGLARLDSEENDGMTKTGQVMGTPDYMAPEQGWNTADVDIRADIYSLGCTIFRLVTGGVPFPGDNPLQVLMARCSTDAPLASSVVPDLDPRIDAVLRRMTWRDPLKRFQTPEEVVAALEPLCEIPAAEDFQGGTGSSSPSSQATMVAGSTSDGPAEPSFQGFLREMDSGAEVTLMQGATEGFSTGQRPSGSQASRRSSSPRKKAGKLPLIIGGLVLILGGGGAALMMSGGGDQGGTKPGKQTGATIQPPAKKVRYFADIGAQRVEPGEVISFYATPDFTDELDGVTYEIGEGAPKDATLDPDSGEFYWLPPMNQESGRITVQLIAKRGDKVEAEKSVFIDIKAAALNAKIVEFNNVAIPSDKPWVHKLELFGRETPEGAVRFELVGNPPEGLKLDSKTGEIQWSPTPQQVGRHPISVQLVEAATERILHSASCSLLVARSANTVMRRLVINPQSVEVGQELQVDLTKSANQNTPARMRWQLDSSTAWGGAAVDPVSGVFRWTAPKEAVGDQSFKFNLSLPKGGVGTATMLVKVTPSPMGNSTGESSEIAAAEVKIRELFKRDFASRSASTKRQLAEKLLTRSFEDGSDSMKFALLKLATEVARDAKAYSVGAEAVQELQARFQADSVERMTVLLDGFRTRGLSASNKLMVAESAVREAFVAVQSSRFKSAAQLIEVADSLGTAGGYVDVTKQAARLLKSLPLDSDEPEALSDEQMLAKNQLSDLLAKYQFRPIFRAKSGLTVLGGKDDPTAGAELWEVQDGRISMESEPSEMVTGLIDPGVNHVSFVLRMKVSSDSSIGALILGAPAQGDLNGSIVIPLAGSESYQVQVAGNAQPVAGPKVRISRGKSEWNLVEVQVVRTRLTVKLNSRIVTETRLPEPPRGSIGVVSVLRANIAEPKFRAANVRVMGIVE